MQAQMAPVAVGVLAGERNAPGEIAQAEGVPYKVLVEIDRVPMLQRVLQTLARALPGARCYLSGPDQPALERMPELAAQVASGQIAWQPAQGSPARSAVALLDVARADARAGAGSDTELLLTTGDHPLLQEATVQAFVSEAQQTEADLVVGLASFDAVQAAFPAGRRTALRFAEGSFCGCNLFYVRGDAGRKVLSFWQQLEQHRKRPDRMLATLGWTLVLRYLLRRLTLAEALRRLGKRCDARVAMVPVADPDAAVDVDSLADLALVRARWQERSG